MQASARMLDVNALRDASSRVNALAEGAKPASRRHEAALAPLAEWSAVSRSSPSRRPAPVRRENVQRARRYLPRVARYLREVECHAMVAADYMDRVQQQVTEKMRMILIDWLVDVNLKYKCRPETFFLTVSLIDRYLARRQVMKSKLQLLGCACMMIAAKFEEMFPPEVGDYVHISANTYTRDEMLAMEADVLQELDFRLALPTAHAFTRQLVDACNDSDATLLHGAMYLAEHCQLNYGALRHAPSLQAAACVRLARLVLKPTEQPYPAELHRATGVDEGALGGCCDMLREWMVRAPTHRFQALRKKYTHAKYGEVARRFDSWASRAAREDAAVH
eukprot:Hpha_TRINITY_DN16076_c1_g1::TRINITY_DN16076_c1_g1_i10::g.119165::m.119165/K06627/CCNA; cyclin-A